MMFEHLDRAEQAVVLAAILAGRERLVGIAAPSAARCQATLDGLRRLDRNQRLARVRKMTRSLLAPPTTALQSPKIVALLDQQPLEVGQALIKVWRGMANDADPALKAMANLLLEHCEEIDDGSHHSR
ncbi:MAG: hypothetical protein H6707_14135 [Deltaproteobacteria bacterium]|nr:hypothetical protein [Deltaproteobacteria bacterium]